ncbi:MAG: AAA family ATPase [Deltaproteobacteria bacterium]|nr:AAA family ATPase [Deltaproteobacteria bacterium]
MTSTAHTPPIPRPAWIEVAGFKALREAARLELRPLTLIAGANSAGKSSAMQPLLLMKQTLEAAYDPGPLLLDGPHVQFTQLDQLLTRGAGQGPRALSVTFGTWSIGVGAAKQAWGPGPVRVRLVAPEQVPPPFSFDPPIVEQAIAGGWVHIREGMPVEDYLRVLYARSPMAAAMMHAEADSLGVQTYRPGRLLAPSVVVRPRPGQEPEYGGPVFGPGIVEPLDGHEQFLRAILHLPGLRGHRERRYNVAQVAERAGGIQAQGPFTPYAASLLARWQDEGDARLGWVQAALQATGLTSTVDARRVSAAELELKVGRTAASTPGGAQDLVDIADVGFGVSQVLPVIVALAAAAPGQLVYVEQPELHLHPRAQRAMGRLLAQAAQRGVCVVAETHSRLLLRAVQTEVARGALAPDEVGLHWFSRDPESGFATVRLAELDRRGTFGDWPVDFADVEAEADEEWLDLALAAEAR